MRATFPDELPLICPRCRGASERGLELYTLTLVARGGGQDGDEVRDGTLGCVNEACGERYPIVDGIPIVVKDLAAFLAGQLSAVVEGELDVATAALLAGAGPDGAPFTQLVDHLSIYLDAQWGDRATPAPDGALGPWGFGALAERLASRRQDRVPLAVELGAGVGRGLAELARGADRVVGVDLHFGALRRARRLLTGEPLAYLRRRAGRHYDPAIAVAGDVAAPHVELVCADALDPPLAPGSTQRVVALNLYDVVHDPAGLVAVLDGLCAPGGELLLSSPFNFQSDTVAESHRPTAADPAADLARRLVPRYTLAEEVDLPWWLRRDARSSVSYSVRYLRAVRSL